jgi:hypothetical protein
MAMARTRPFAFVVILGFFSIATTLIHTTVPICPPALAAPACNGKDVVHLPVQTKVLSQLLASPSIRQPGSQLSYKGQQVEEQESAAGKWHN